MESKSPACIQGSYLYQTSYLMPRSSEDIICSLIGYNDLTISNSIFFDDNTYEIIPHGLTLNFTEEVEGIILSEEDEDFIQYFTNSTLILEQYILPEGIIKIEFNKNGTEYRQLYVYNNDLKTTISDKIYVMNNDINDDLTRTVKVIANNQEISGARVCQKYPTETEYMTSYCDYSKSDGTTSIRTIVANLMQICVQKNGYTPTCQLVRIDEQDSIITITLSDERSNFGLNAIYTSCPRYYYSNISACNLEVNTFQEYYSICINMTKYVNDIEQDNSFICEYESISEFFNYGLTTDYDKYKVEIQLDGEIYSTFYHYNSTDNAEVKIDLEQGNNFGYNLEERLKSSPELFVMAHIMFLIIGIVGGMVIEKHYEGKGLYGVMAFFALLGAMKLYLFFLPVGIIVVYLIIKGSKPLIEN